MARCSVVQLDQHAADVRRDGITILPGHVDPDLLRAWAAAYAPPAGERYQRFMD